MQLYFELLVSYDIRSNKNRNKLYNALKDMGLISVQKSVFWGHLKSAEVAMLSHLFEKYCDKNDKAFFIKANLSKEIIKNSFGYDEIDFEVSDHEYL